MAEPPSKPEAPGKRVAVVTPDGEFGTIDEKYADEVVKAGGRVLTKQQAAEREVQEKYDALPTGRKVLGGVAAAAGLATGNPLIAGQGADLPPTLAAYGEGAREGATAGLSQAATRKFADAVGGEAAGDQYAADLQTQKTASPVAHEMGSIAGMTGASVLGGAGGPVGGISAAGEAIEAGAAKALSNLAARGAVGRAATAAISMGARGAAEGALYNVAQTAADSITQNVDLTADKLFAAAGSGALWGGGGGAALGGLGSLAMSGLGAVAKRLGEDVPKPKALAEGAAADEVAVASKAEGTATHEGVESLADRAEDWVDKQANEQAWKAIGAGHGLQGTRFAKLAKQMGGTDVIGEVINRRVLNNDTIWSAAKSGKPADLLPRIVEERSAVGAQLGQITEASGARIPVGDISDAMGRVRAEPAAIAGNENVTAAIDNYHMSLLEHLPIAKDGTVSIQDLLRQRQGLDQIVYQETKTLDPGRRVAALREIRGEMESLITDTLDKASDQIPGAAKAEYQSLKHDYRALAIAQDVADDSAARMAKARSISPTDYAAGLAAAASGHVFAAPVAAIGHKLVKERGNAVLAVALRNIADSGAVSKLVAHVDEMSMSASRGLLTKPMKALPEPHPTERPRVIALSVMKQIAALQSDPQGTMDSLAKEAEPIAATSPELANAMTQRQASSLSFLASKMPVTADPDPLDPHPAPHMTDGQAAEFARYAWYAQKPSRFFAEAAAGKMTPEGAETAQALMPLAFAELQQRTMDALATHMARGRSIPFQQRLKIGTLLGIPATPSQTLEHGSFLQGNIVSSPPKPSAAPAKPRSTKLPSSETALDRLEGSGPGRR